MTTMQTAATSAITNTDTATPATKPKSLDNPGLSVHCFVFCVQVVSFQPDHESHSVPMVTLVTVAEI